MFIGTYPVINDKDKQKSYADDLKRQIELKKERQLREIEDEREYERRCFQDFPPKSLNKQRIQSYQPELKQNQVFKNDSKDTDSFMQRNNLLNNVVDDGFPKQQAAATYTRFRFDSLEPYQQDQYMKRQESKKAQRDILQEQMEAQKVKKALERQKEREIAQREEENTYKVLKPQEKIDFKDPEPRHEVNPELTLNPSPLKSEKSPTNSSIPNTIPVSTNIFHPIQYSHIQAPHNGYVQHTMPQYPNPYFQNPPMQYLPPLESNSGFPEQHPLYSTLYQPNHPLYLSGNILPPQLQYAYDMNFREDLLSDQIRMRSLMQKQEKVIETLKRESQLIREEREQLQNRIREGPIESKHLKNLMIQTEKEVETSEHCLNSTSQLIPITVNIEELMKGEMHSQSKVVPIVNQDDRYKTIYSFSPSLSCQQDEQKSLSQHSIDLTKKSQRNIIINDQVNTAADLYYNQNYSNNKDKHDEQEIVSRGFYDSQAEDELSSTGDTDDSDIGLLSIEDFKSLEDKERRNKVGNNYEMKPEVELEENLRFKVHTPSELERRLMVRLESQAELLKKSMKPIVLKSQSALK